MTLAGTSHTELLRERDVITFLPITQADYILNESKMKRLQYDPEYFELDGHIV